MHFTFWCLSTNFLWSLENIEHNITKSLCSLVFLFFFPVHFMSRKSLFIPKLVKYLTLISHDFIINFKFLNFLNLFVICLGVCQNTPDKWVSNLNPCPVLTATHTIFWPCWRDNWFHFIGMNGDSFKKGIQEGSWMWN